MCNFLKRIHLNADGFIWKASAFCDKTRDNGFKQELIQTRYQKDVFHIDVKHWQRVVDAPSLETVQGQVEQGSE